jgi:hypothetical protein
MGGINPSEVLKQIQEAADLKVMAEAKQDQRVWGYREADNEQGYEGKIFANKAERDKAGWIDTPHKFVVETEKANEAIKELALRKVVQERKEARAKLLAEAGHKPAKSASA